MTLRSLALSLCLAAVAPGATLTTCTIQRWSQAAGAHQTAVTDTGVLGCSADYSEQVTFPNGDVHTLQKNASASVAGALVTDERGFFGSFIEGDEPDSGYFFLLNSSVGGNGVVTIDDLFPGGSTAEEYAYGVAEVNFEFYRRTITITNPLAVFAGFAAAPHTQCFSQTFASGTCSVDWTTNTPVQLGNPLTITGTASVHSDGINDAQDANLILSFRTPDTYTLNVRDAQGNIIPESQWNVVPEPATWLLIGTGLIVSVGYTRRRLPRS